MMNRKKGVTNFAPYQTNDEVILIKTANIGEEILVFRITTALLGIKHKVICCIYSSMRPPSTCYKEPHSPYGRFLFGDAN